MHFVDIERIGELVLETDFRMFELVVSLGEDGGAVAVVLERTGEGIAAELPATLLLLHGEFVVESMAEIGNEAFPNTGIAATFHRMSIAVPVVEAAHDGDALCIRRPDREAHASIDRVSA